MRQALRQAFEPIENTAGVLGSGLVDINGNIVHAVGEHGGFDVEALAVHLPQAEWSPLERTLGRRFQEEVLSNDEVVVVLRRFSEGRMLLYALVASGSPLGPLRHRLGECAEILRDILDADSTSPQRQRLEDVRKFGPGPLIGQDP